VRKPDANRSLSGRLTRLLAGMLGGEPNYLSRPDRRDELDALIARTATLTDDDLALLTEGWEREDPELRRQVWTKARSVIERSGYSDVLEDFRHELGAWALARGSDFHGIEGLLGKAGAPASGRQAAAPAIIDKAAALLASDHLDEAERSVLARPWDSLPR
jgi:hypothetical protein